MNTRINQYREIDFEGDNIPCYFQCSYCRKIDSKGRLHMVGESLYRFTCAACIQDPTRTVKK